MIRIKKQAKDTGQINLNTKDKIDNIYQKGLKNYVDFIYPSGIDVMSPGYINVDGGYIACLLCFNYPYQVQKSLFEEIINYGEGVEVIIKQRPGNKTEIIRDITHYLGFTKNKIATGGENQIDSGLQENALSHSIYMKKRLAEGDNIWFMNTIIIVSSDSPEGLEIKLKTVEGILSGKDIFYKRADFRQLEAFLCTLPINKTNKRIMAQTERNILSSGLCSLYPFTSSSLSDPEGMFMGINAHDGTRVIIDIFDTDKYSNANMVLLGGSGSGKTFTTQMFTGRFRMQKIPVMMICPLKGHEYKKLSNNVGGNYFKITAGSPHTINMLDIRPTKNIENSDVSLLAAKIQKLQIFFTLMFPDITQRHLKLLDSLFTSVYGKKGITMNNASIYKRQLGNESGYISLSPALKEMPILEDVRNEMMENDELKELVEEMEQFITGSLKCFNGQTNIDLDNLYNVADISEMPNHLIPLAMFMVLDIYWDRVKADVTQKIALVLDELWRLMGNTLSAEFVLEIFKTIRGYGGSAIGATQDIEDFLALENGKYGRGIINNSKIKIVLGLEELAAQAVQPVLSLSEEEMIKVRHFEKGHGLLYAGSNHLAMKFTPFQSEIGLITTDRKEILKYRTEV